MKRLFKLYFVVLLSFTFLNKKCQMEIQTIHLIGVVLVLLLVLLGVQAYHLKSGSKCTTVSELQVHSDGTIEVDLTTSCAPSPEIPVTAQSSDGVMLAPVVEVAAVGIDKLPK